MHFIHFIILLGRNWFFLGSKRKENVLIKAGKNISQLDFSERLIFSNRTTKGICIQLVLLYERFPKWFVKFI